MLGQRYSTSKLTSATVGVEPSVGFCLANASWMVS